MGQDVLSSPKKKNWEEKLAWLLLEALRTMDRPGAVKSDRASKNLFTCISGHRCMWEHRRTSVHALGPACTHMCARVHLRVFFQGMFWPPVCRVLLKPADWRYYWNINSGRGKRIHKALTLVRISVNSPLPKHKEPMGIGQNRVNFPGNSALVFLIQWPFSPFSFKEPHCLLSEQVTIIILAFKQNQPRFYWR